MGEKYIAGIDEAGRGPLAGPVVAAAVIFSEENLDRMIEMGVNDSKKLTPKKREELKPYIIENAVAYSVCQIENEVIDEINILQSTLKAMEKCFYTISPKPTVLLIDGINTINLNITEPKITQTAIKKGDMNSVSIAAASILAKVARDSIMEQYHEIYPMYNFKKHKGYGTKEHIEKIKEYGPSPIHRRSFIGKIFKK